MVHVGLAPLHAPPQPVNPGPLAVNVTDVPAIKLLEHVAKEQFIPVGIEVIVPPPSPLRVTVNVAGLVKLATTLRLLCIAIVQVRFVPLQAPLHPVKVLPG